MRNPALVVTSILFLVSVGNVLRFLTDGNFRAVEFFSVFATGFLGGVLLLQFIRMKRGKP